MFYETLKSFVTKTENSCHTASCRIKSKI